MDFEDSAAEAAFRAEARAWIEANAPKHLHDGLLRDMAKTTSSVHPPEIHGFDPVRGYRVFVEAALEEAAAEPGAGTSGASGASTA